LDELCAATGDVAVRRGLRRRLPVRDAVGFCADLLLAMSGSFPVVTANAAVTTETPQWAYGRRGRIPGIYNPSIAGSDAPITAEVQFIVR
jgi:hypothetical protein